MIKILKEKGITIYSLAKALNRSPQNMEYIVKKKDFKKHFDLLNDIAVFVGCDAKDLL